jgi:NMT1/THI5 like
MRGRRRRQANECLCGGEILKRPKPNRNCHETSRRRNSTTIPTLKNPNRPTVIAGSLAAIAAPSIVRAQATNITFVRPETINGSGPVLRALASGQAQFGHRGPAPLLSARARSVDVVFIYNIFARTNFGIVVADASTVQKPADPKGQCSGPRVRSEADYMKTAQDAGFRG